MMKNDWKQARELAGWWKHIMYNWGDVAVREVHWDPATEVEVESAYHVEAVVALGEIQPQDVVVDAYYGRIDQRKFFVDRFTAPMKNVKPLGDGVYAYECDIAFEEAGHFGLNIRVTPNHPNPKSRHAMGLVAWGHG
jgi:starch phosphorylase